MLSVNEKEEKFLRNDDNTIKLPQTARKLQQGLLHCVAAKWIKMVKDTLGESAKEKRLRLLLNFGFWDHMEWKVNANKTSF